MINSFNFGGVDSYTAMGLLIEKRPQPIASLHNYEAIEVEGRDDTIFIDKGNYKNVPLVYQVACTDIDRKIETIRKNIHKKTGYIKLTDTYHTGGFFRAFLANPIQFTEDLLNFGHAQIEFSAEPWFFLNSGENEVTVSTRSTVIENPESFYKSLPIITANGTAGTTITLYIDSNSYSFKIPTGATQIVIDCKEMTAYDNHNNNATGFLNFEEFPYLDNSPQIIVSRTGGTSMTIKPRWRRLI